MNRLKQWLSGLQLSLFDDTPLQNESVLPVNPEPKARQRQVVLDGQVVPYTIERTRRRTVGMLIDAKGLRVRANSGVSVAEIERILQSKTKWLLKNLHKQRNQTQQPQVSFVPDLNMLDGTTFKLLGREVVVRWVVDKVEFNAANFWFGHETELVLQDVVESKKPQKLLDAVVDVLNVFLDDRAKAHAKAFNLRYRSIVLSSAKTLWGTCRTDGVIRINWRLAFLDARLADYVLIHELAHTVQMNHSAKFWAQVALMCPDYKLRVKEMKQYNLRAA